MTATYSLIFDNEIWHRCYILINGVTETRLKNKEQISFTGASFTDRDDQNKHAV